MRLAERSPAAAGTSGGTVPKGGREKEDAREKSVEWCTCILYIDINHNYKA